MKYIARLFKGRITRGYFVRGLLVLSLLLLLVAFITDVLAGIIGNTVFLLFLVYIIVQIVLSSALWVRRLHDTGHSALWLLLIFVPILNFVILIWLLSDPGNEGANTYGKPRVGNMKLLNEILNLNQESDNIPQELKDYITQSRSAAISDSVIREKLLEQGWAEGLISEALNKS